MYLILVAMLATGAPGDSLAPAAPDTQRVVRHFPPIEVSASRVYDLRSSATVHVVTPEALRDLPVSSLAQVLALQPGVVAVGEDLHVRGGRAGETQWTLDGLTLNEPLRDRAPDVPLMAVQRAELLAGGLDAEYAGTLAGVIALQTWNPGERPGGALRWMSTGRLGTSYDWLGARGSTPLGVGGLGLVGAIEARLDDQDLPGRPSRGRAELLGRRFGWRNDNHLSAWTKLAPVANPQALSFEVLGSRAVTQPYDPMYAWDDSIRTQFYTSPCELCPGYIDSITAFYRAADHQLMTETRRLVATLQASRLGTRLQWHVATSWQHGSELTSPGLLQDPRERYGIGKVAFGQDADPEQSPFLAIAGEVPYFRRAKSDRVQGAFSAAWQQHPNSRFELGAGMLYDWADSYELDSALPTSPLVDTLRTYRTHAPGGWAYVQHRGEREGLVWNTGLRLQMFSAGDATARAGTSPLTGLPLPAERGAGPIWTLSPRVGLAMPLSVRDAFSASYARIHQSPGRDYLADDRLLVYGRRPLGTPALEPGELVTYQMGLKHLFNARWAFQASLFHRDLYGQVGIVNDPYYSGTYRPRYANSEYGHATGFEVALLADARKGATPPRGSQPLLRRFLAGEFSLRYTQTDADGSISGTDGWYYGDAFGFRPVSVGEHPLDWDRGPMLEFDAVWREPHVFTLAWVTQVSGGPRWTPTNDTLSAGGGPPGTAPNLKAVNSLQLPAVPRTDVSLRLEPPALRGLRVLLDVRNLFGFRGASAASVPGYPNPAINSARDDYGGYRTLTGQGGGAYWDPRLNGGQGGWVPVHDPRLLFPARSVRLGFELGL